MGTGEPKSLANILSESTALKRLDKAASERRQRAEAVRCVLPADLAPHLVAAELEGRRLILVLDSDQWAARARYLGPELNPLLASTGATSFGVRVLPR